MKQQLYGMVVIHKRTGREHKLMVWAENVREAAVSLSDIVTGHFGEYVWTGCLPECDADGKIITREVKEA